MASETLDQVLELSRVGVDDLGGDGVDDDGPVRRLADLVGVFGDLEGGRTGTLELNLFSFSHGIRC